MNDVTLSAGEDELPLAFSQYETLTQGAVAPFQDAKGRPLFGRRLEKALKAEGIGPKLVQIELQIAEQGGGPLSTEIATARLVGTLDPSTLARVVHDRARTVMSRKGPKGNSPAEAYVTGIVVEPAKAEKPTRRRPTAKRAKKRRTPARAPAKKRPPATRAKKRPPAMPAKKAPVQAKRRYVNGRTIYQDARGRFVDRATWKRSLAARKGAATRKANKAKHAKARKNSRRR